MQRPASANTVILGNGKTGYGAGTPGVTPPTTLDLNVLNSVDEEIAGVIEGLGGTLYTAPDTTYGQLLGAVKKLSCRNLMANLAKTATVSRSILGIAFGLSASGQPIWVGVGVNLGAGPLIVYSYDGLTWNAPVGFSAKTLDLNAVAYGGGVWVAVGNSDSNKPFVVTAVDPTGVWTQNVSMGLSTTPNLFGVAYSNVGGSGYFTAVGSPSSSAATVIYTATPTGAWTAKAGLPNATLHAVAVDTAGHYVAVGSVVAGKPCVLTASQPPSGTWSQDTSVPTVAADLLAVATDNSTWCAVGKSDGVRPLMLTASTFSGTWVQNTAGVPSLMAPLNAIAVNHGVWVAGGDSSSSMTPLYVVSFNPASVWSQSLAAEPSATFYALSAGNGALVASWGPDMARTLEDIA